MNALVQRALAVEKNRRGAGLPGCRELVESGEGDGKRWQVYASDLPGGWRLVQTITHWRQTRDDKSTLLTKTHVAVIDEHGVIRAEEDV